MKPILIKTRSKVNALTTAYTVTEMLSIAPLALDFVWCGGYDRVYLNLTMASLIERLASDPLVLDLRFCCVEA